METENGNDEDKDREFQFDIRRHYIQDIIHYVFLLNDYVLINDTIYIR